MFWSGNLSEVIVTDETLGVGWHCYWTTRCLCWTDQGCRATRDPFSLLARWVSVDVTQFSHENIRLTGVLDFAYRRTCWC